MAVELSNLPAFCHVPLSTADARSGRIRSHVPITCRFAMYHFNPTTEATPSGQLLSFTLAMHFAASILWQVMFGSPS
jgi:hypothetical protein